MTCILIATNLIVYTLTSDGFSIRPFALERFALKGTNFGPVSILTSMFLHANLLHIVGNLWFLYLLGFAVEGRLKWWKFSIVYVGSGICGSLLHHFIIGVNNPELPSLGASGAIMGVLGAALYMFPFAQVEFICIGWMFDGYFQIRPFAMWAIGLIYPGMDLVIALILRDGSDGVAHFAHIGGVAGGFILCMLFRPKRDSRTASDAKAMLAETDDLALLSRIELQEMAKANPDDALLTMHWMTRSIHDQRVDSACRDAFIRLLPRMIEEQPASAVGSCLLAFVRTGHPVSTRMLVQVAAACEKDIQPSLGLKLYETAWADPNLALVDRESILFRVAIICETSLGNEPRAVASYQEIIRGNPMSPMAEKARVRLKALQARTLAAGRVELASGYLSGLKTLRTFEKSSVQGRKFGSGSVGVKSI